MNHPHTAYSDLIMEIARCIKYDDIFKYNLLLFCISHVLLQSLNHVKEIWNKIHLCEIWGSHGTDYEAYSFLGCETM
jgi:hypothetical protein